MQGGCAQSFVCAQSLLRTILVAHNLSCAQSCLRPLVAISFDCCMPISILFLNMPVFAFVYIYIYICIYIYIHIQIYFLYHIFESLSLVVVLIFDKLIDCILFRIGIH